MVRDMKAFEDGARQDSRVEVGASGCEVVAVVAADLDARQTVTTVHGIVFSKRFVAGSMSAAEVSATWALKVAASVWTRTS